MWPSTLKKNITPHLSLLVSLSFSTNNVCKNAVFFLAVSFPKKAFVFPNNRISEARICRQCWLKKISRKRKPKQQKKLPDNVFLLSPRSHAKIELIWTRKKFRPKKSLTSLLHAALQLFYLDQYSSKMKSFALLHCYFEAQDCACQPSFHNSLSITV